MGETVSNSSERRPGRSARHPPATGETWGPSGTAVGRRPSNSTVAPDRAVP